MNQLKPLRLPSIRRCEPKKKCRPLFECAYRNAFKKLALRPYTKKQRSQIKHISEAKKINNARSISIDYIAEYIKYICFK